MSAEHTATRRFRKQGGFTLVELMIGVGIAVAIAAGSASLLRDHMATAKTLRVAAEANLDLTNLLRDIRRTFQTSFPVGGMAERSCVLNFNGAPSERADITKYSCVFASSGQDGMNVRTEGIGFAINNSRQPSIAYVNACEDIAGVARPNGRSGPLDTQPRHPSRIANWGSAGAVCPADCPDNTRPVVKYLDLNKGEIVQRQFPKRVQSSSDLRVWGGVICAVYYRDVVRRLQGLYGDNTGAFAPNYMSISAFIARGRFDIPRPQDPQQSHYIWMHGGVVLDFNDSQEMSTFRCSREALAAGDRGCVP